MLGINQSHNHEPVPQAVPTSKLSSATRSGISTPEEKISLFRDLFRGREDVFAIRWEGKSGKSSYSPASVMDWRAIHVARPEERKKVARKTSMLQPLTDDAIRNHVTGKQTVGIYPLLPDDCESVSYRNSRVSGASCIEEWRCSASHREPRRLSSRLKIWRETTQRNALI
jgi:hypothetical protein